MKKSFGIPTRSAFVCLLSLFPILQSFAIAPPVVGVVRNFSWAGGVGDPIQLSMQVSTANKSTLAALMRTTLSNTQVEFKFDIYDYDPVAHAYYKCVHSDGVTLLGLIQRTSGEFAMSLDPDQSGEVVSPANYNFFIGIMPQEISQNIYRAVYAAGSLTMKWGVTLLGKVPQSPKTAVAMDLACSVQQGFNFQRDEPARLGFVNGIKIGGVTLAADLHLSSVDEVLPVELQSFSAKTLRGNVELKWSTATEVNNRGFEVERYAGGSWRTIGFVEGAGTTNTPKMYSFVDRGAKGSISYRLKQIDRNGHFIYSQSVEVTVALTAEDYGLAQNYPNPFNPSTTITFAMRGEEHVNLSVYNSLGQAVATLFNSVAKPNEIYSLSFDGRNLSSGTYFSVLRSPSRCDVKKMTMMK